MANKHKILQRLQRSNVPVGSNKLRSRRLYENRKLYKRLHERRTNTIDFWYRDTLYGRIDHSGNAVYPSEGYLKQFRGTNCALYALSFVVDAYQDFVRRFVSQNLGNPIFTNEKYLFPMGLKAKKAWVSTSQLYHGSTESIYRNYVQTFLGDRNNNKQVVSFGDFVKSFLSYLNEIGTHAPFTRTGLITSLQCTPNISGLCVEFSFENYAEDIRKHEGFFMSEFFFNYLQTAKAHGFRVDVNAPWRLVADLTSPKMQQYMSEYDLNAENVFERCYVQSYVHDVPALKVYFKQIFNSFVVSQPRIRTSANTTIYRKPIRDKEYNVKYGDDFWIHTYAKIRHGEVLENYSLEEFNDVVRKAKYLKKELDMDAAIAYINKQFLGQLTPTV